MSRFSRLFTIPHMQITYSAIVRPLLFPVDKFQVLFIIAKHLHSF